MRISLVAITKLLSVPVVLGMLGACAAPTDDDATAESSQDLTANESTAFKFFVDKGLAHYQAAGIVGNLIQESGVSPTIAQPGGPGRGIAQWSEGGRWNADHDDNVEWYAAKEKSSMTSLNLQLEFIWYELQTFPSYGLKRLKDSANITDATVAFQTDFEGCGECDESKRIDYAKQVLSGNGGGSEGAAPKGCFSDTLGKEMPANACVQSRSDKLWYQCDNGDWVDRWDDPSNCDGVYPL